MSAVIRKKSPRAPSFSLEEALEKTLKIYEKERLHAAPSDVVAQDIGYKSAGNGAALQALASLRYYGVVERPKDGFLAVSKDFERYRFAPDEDQKRQILIRFLKAPPLFADLLEKYSAGLPSDATLRYELIERGFSPAAAESALSAMRKSVDFSKYYFGVDVDPHVESDNLSLDANNEDVALPTRHIEASITHSGAAAKLNATVSPGVNEAQSDHDQVPVRLTGGRRAWLILPSVFLEADKARIKAQLDLILTKEDEEADS